MHNTQKYITLIYWKSLIAHLVTLNKVGYSEEAISAKYTTFKCKIADGHTEKHKMFRMWR